MPEATVTLEDFKRNWEMLIAKIEKEAIDGEGVNLIRLCFDRDRNLFEMGVGEDEFTHEMYVELNMLESKLEAALQFAHSRFRLKNRGVLARIFGGIAERILKK